MIRAWSNLFPCFIRLLFSERGEAGGDGGSGGEGDGGGGGGGAGGDAWYSSLPEELTAEHEGKTIALRDHPFIKETPDVATLAKRAYDNHRAVGSSIKLPGKDAKPEEVQALKAKLYEAGLFEAPPESAEKYELELDTIPEELRAEATVKSVREWAHRNGISQKAVTELMEIEGKRYADAGPLLEYNRHESEGVIAGKAEKDGMTMHQVMAYGGAWLTKNISPDGMRKLVVSGLANDPEISYLIAKAGRDSGEDISFLEGQSDPKTDADYDDVRRMMTDKSHPMHEKWRRGDPEANAKVEAAYRRKFGTREFIPQGSEE